MREIIEKDLTLLGVLARLVERLAADGRRLKPRQVVAEFDNYLHDELDLIREASNCSQLRRNFSPAHGRSEEHTSELQSLMRISYAVFCLKTKSHNTKSLMTYYI